VQYEGKVSLLDEIQEFVNGEACVADEGAQCAYGKLFVLRDGEIDADAGFLSDEMAADLSDGRPAGALEALAVSFPEILLMRPMRLDGHNYRRFTGCFR